MIAVASIAASAGAIAAAAMSAYYARRAGRARAEIARTQAERRNR